MSFNWKRVKRDHLKDRKGRLNKRNMPGKEGPGGGPEEESREGGGGVRGSRQKLQFSLTDPG